MKKLMMILAGAALLATSAPAFAGNDRVYFGGGPLAAYESYNSFVASGVAANLFTMESLKQAVQTPTIFLLLSGLIMVLPLWFS